MPESCSPVTACIQTLFFSVVQIYVSHFLLGLDVVGLLRRDVPEHAQRQLRISSQQGQVSVGYGHTELLRRSRELVDCILHHFGCFVLPDQRNAWVPASHCWKTLRKMRWDSLVLRWATRPLLTPGRQRHSQQDSDRSSCAWTLRRMQPGGRSADSWPSAESESPPSARPSSSWPGPWSGGTTDVLGSEKKEKNKSVQFSSVVHTHTPKKFLPRSALIPLSGTIFSKQEHLTKLQLQFSFH